MNARASLSLDRGCERDQHCDPDTVGPEPNVAPALPPHCHLAARSDSTGASSGLTDKETSPRSPGLQPKEGQSPKLFLLRALAQERKKKTKPSTHTSRPQAPYSQRLHSCPLLSIFLIPPTPPLQPKKGEHQPPLNTDVLPLPSTKLAAAPRPLSKVQPAWPACFPNKCSLAT